MIDIPIWLLIVLSAGTGAGLILATFLLIRWYDERRWNRYEHEEDMQEAQFKQALKMAKLEEPTHD